MDESRKVRVMQKLTTMKSQSPEQKSSISLKIQATEVKKLIEKLQSEIFQICATKRSLKSKELVRVLDKYTEQTIPFSLVSHTSSMVRRLTALLIALIFEHKSDLFRFRVLNNNKNMCLFRNQLFLTKMSPAIRNSRPEPLYHVKKALMYYLPTSTFPKGLTCYLDDAKLTNVFIEGEFLRLPDPMEQIVWMEFEELTSDFPLLDNMLLTDRLQTDSSRSSSQTISSSSDLAHSNSKAPLADGKKKRKKQNSNNNMQLLVNDSSPQSSVGKNNPKLARLESLDEQGKLDSLFEAVTKLKKEAKQESVEDLDDCSANKQSVHRVKCFQFFRKQKKDQPVGSSETLDSAVSVDSQRPNREDKRARQLEFDDLKSPVKGMLLDDKIVTQLPPQFESVNDWATDKDYAYFQSQMRFIPVKATAKKNQSIYSQATSEHLNLIPSQQMEKKKYNLQIQTMVSDLLKQENQKGLNGVIQDGVQISPSNLIKVDRKPDRTITPQKASIRVEVMRSGGKNKETSQFDTKQQREVVPPKFQGYKTFSGMPKSSVVRSQSPYRITHKVGPQQTHQGEGRRSTIFGAQTQIQLQQPQADMSASNGFRNSRSRPLAVPRHIKAT